MTLLTPVKVGGFQLKHRVVISPPSHDLVASGVEDFYRRAASDGGLVLVPSSGQTIDVSTRKSIVDVVHNSSGVVFYRVDASDGPSENLASDLKLHVSDAIASGFDGVELDGGDGSMLQRVLHGSQLSSAVALLVEILQAITAILPAERLGIRFAPFAMVDGLRLSDPLAFYMALIKAIRLHSPSLAFVHFVSSTTFDDFEYASDESLDAFRAALAFPYDIGTKTSSGPLFMSSNDYSGESAAATTARTGDLVAIGLPSATNPNVVSLLRTGTPLQHPAPVSKRLDDIDSSFKTGKEYVFAWDSNQYSRVMSAMADLESYLDHFDPALSYEGTDKKVVWRKSCWFASKGIAHPLLDSEADIAKFDGDLKDGLSGLRALQDGRVRSSLEYLKHVLDSSLVTTSRALGIGAEMIQRCTVRYRIIKYTPHAGNPGGIGLHPDGNLLSALITNGPGLGVYDFDGTYREPGFNGTILMGGSTLYRWSQGAYLPTFHNVSIGEGQQKASIVAFFNFPDMVDIPRSVVSGEEGSSFFHDIRRIKEDDKSPTGELAPLWDVIIDKHKIVLPP